MIRRIHGRADAAAAAAALVATDLVIRLLVGEPYLGSTSLLVLACGVSALPFLPAELAPTSLRLAVVPALGLASFAVLLTTISIVGVRLTELTIRLAVAAFVAALGLLARATTTRSVTALHATSRRAGEGVALAGLACVLAFALASAWDVVGPFPPPGVDWGHYLLYADEVETQRRILIDDPFAGEEGRIFADSPGVGAVYGGERIVDGIPSSWLSYAIILVSALTCLSVYAAAGALWGMRAGLVASAAWAVAPIHMDPIRWHGVGTNLALLFVPLVVLSLGLLYRGRNDWRVVVLLGISLLGVAVMHSTSTFVVAFVLGAALLADAIRQAAKGRSVRALRRWWRNGIVRPLLAGVVLAGIAGAGVVVHLRAQANDLGSPVDYRNFEPDWLSWRVVEDYYSLAFLALAVASVVLVWASRELRRDAALLSLVAIAVACVVVGQLWRLQVPFEYRRAVYYLGVGMAILVGAGSLRLGTRTAAVGYAAILLYVAHVAVGLGLPGRLLSAPGEPMGRAAVDIMDFAEKVNRGELPDASLVVADRCHNFVVPYLLRRPTLVAFEPWQVGFESRVLLAERASAILAGDRTGRRLARSLGVGYVLANPSCTPELARRLDGRVVTSTDGLVVVDVRDAAQ